jgi:hypothetical protein
VRKHSYREKKCCEKHRRHWAIIGAKPSPTGSADGGALAHGDQEFRDAWYNFLQMKSAS